MLTVMPEENKSLLEKFNCVDNGAVLVVRDGITELGHAVVCQREDTLEICEICIDGAADFAILNFDQKYLGELLIRAAGNYAANRNIFIMESTDMNVFFLAEQLGFTQKSEKTVIELSKLFKKCKKNE